MSMSMSMRHVTVRSAGHDGDDDDDDHNDGSIEQVALLPMTLSSTSNNTSDDASLSQRRRSHDRHTPQSSSASPSPSSYASCMSQCMRTWCTMACGFVLGMLLTSVTIFGLWFGVPLLSIALSTPTSLCSSQFASTVGAFYHNRTVGGVHDGCFSNRSASISDAAAIAACFPPCPRGARKHAGVCICKPGWQRVNGAVHCSVIPLSNRLVILPLMVYGLNNQLQMLTGALDMARQLGATLCRPLMDIDGLTYEGYLGDYHNLSRLYDMHHLEQCIADHWHVRMVPPHDTITPQSLSYWDDVLCRHWQQLPVLDHSMRTMMHEVDVPPSGYYPPIGDDTWPYELENIPVVVYRRHPDGASPCAGDMHDWMRLFDGRGTIHDLAPLSLHNMGGNWNDHHTTAATATGSTATAPDKNNNNNDGRIDRPPRVVVLGFCILYQYIYTIRHPDAPISMVMPKDYGIAPLFSHHCIKPVASLQRVIDIVHQYARDAVATATNKDDGAPATSLPLLGLHLRMEGDMRCAPSMEWLVNRMCNDWRLPCGTSVWLVASGLPVANYSSLIPHRALVTTAMALQAYDDAHRLANTPDSITTYWTTLKREERALVDQMIMIGAPLTHGFVGCGHSTWSWAVWAARESKQQHPNLAYGMNNPFTGGEPRICYPGNRDYMTAHHLTSIKCTDD